MSHFIWKTTNKDIMEQTLQQKQEQLEDFIDARLPMLEYCRKY